MTTKDDLVSWVKDHPGMRPSPFSLDQRDKMLAQWYAENTTEAEEAVEDASVDYKGSVHSGSEGYVDDDLLDNPCRGCMPKHLQKITEDCVGCDKK